MNMLPAFLSFEISVSGILKFKKSSIKQLGLSLYALLCLSYGAFASITPGATSVGVLNNSSSVNISHTTASGSDRLMMVGISAQQPGGSITSLTYNGIALTKLGKYSNPSQTRVEIWYLLAPPVGTYNVVVTNSGSENGIIGIQTFTGVDQSTTFGTPASATGSSTIASVNVGSASGELVFGVVAFNNGDTDLSVGGGQTEYWDQTVNSSVAGAGSTEAGASSVTMSWISTSAPWTVAGVAIKPFAGVCMLDNIGMSRLYGDADTQDIGDSNSDDQDADDFISFINFGGTDVDISGWELYVDQNGTGSPVYTFPSTTIVSPCQEITVISDWNEGPALPANWFDANFTGSEGMFEETSNRVAYAILRNPNTNEYISIHHNSSAPTLGTGTMVCDYSFYNLISTDFDGCEMVYWDASSSTYKVVTACSIYNSYTACIPMVEICGNGIDDDADGLIDCADPDCSAYDNDGDLVCDFFDLDDDNDGIPDVDECNGTFFLDGAHTASTYTTTQLTSTASGVLFDMTLENGITFNTAVGPGLSNFQAGPPPPFNGSQTHLYLEINTDQNVANHGTFTITFPTVVENPTIFFSSFSSSIYSPDWSLTMINQTPGVTMSLLYTDGEMLISGDTIRAEPAPSTNGTGLIEFTGFVQQLQFQIGHYSTSGMDGPVRFTTNVGYNLCSDIDGDGIASMYDLDSDNDGIFDVDEAGHSAADTDDDGIIDGADTGSGVNGLFDGVETTADSDVINYTLSDSESAPDGTYDAYEIDADGDGCYDTGEENISDTDNDGTAGTGVPTVDANGLVTSITYASPTTTYWQNASIDGCSEVCNDGIDNDGDGLVDCADSDCKNIILSNLTVSSCIDHPLADVATLTVDVAWTNPPSGENLLVSISGKTEYINVPGGATSPQTVSFLIPADGSSNDTLLTAWETTTTLCTDTLYYNAPAACSSDTIGCNILYICGPEKPSDGDAWDHGIIEYLDAANGSATLTPAYTKPDPTGMGLYDPMNITVQLFLNLADYDLIYVSTTTENNVATGLIDSLKTTRSAVLNTNYLIINDLGMSASEGFYSFRDSACIDNTNTRTMYNYNNYNSTYTPVILGGHPLANADAYLWYNPGDQAGGINSVYFTYEASDVLPGVASHGKRTFLGFHMNGVYDNPVNGGAKPVPAASWFDPIRHYTIDGKYYFDAALVDIAQGCSLVEICNNSLDDDGDGLVDCDDTDCCCAQAPVLSKN